jgi:hypothetical protein
VFEYFPRNKIFIFLSLFFSLACHKKRPAQRPAEFREDAQCRAALCYPPETTIMCQVYGCLLFSSVCLTVLAHSYSYPLNHYH